MGVPGPLADAGTLARLLDVSAGLPPAAGPTTCPRARGVPGGRAGPVLVAAGAEVDLAAVLAGPAR